jgi:hypothetical protein
VQAIQTELIFINEMGFIIIPRSFQEKSNFKPNRSEQIYNVEFSVNDNFITLKAHKNESSMLRKDTQSRAKVRAIDEVGRVSLPLWCRAEIKMIQHDILVIHLIDKDTIKIRTLERKTSAGEYSNTFFDAHKGIDIMEIKSTLLVSNTLMFYDKYCKLR